VVLLISASQLAGITGVSHQHLTELGCLRDDFPMGNLLSGWRGQTPWDRLCVCHFMETRWQVQAATSEEKLVQV
jgi:hypothetical protein